ncbi:MAG: hypothetical protein LBS45_11960 [Synergistaceae bacterium]|jgi:hypothetical protein|nr:hypothetical protein [Synergistaceae bacterium]
MTGKPHKWRDIAWKLAIADGAKDAIAYFMPDLASDMDASREVTAISGMELPVKGSNSDKGMLVSDVFLNVPVKGGEDWGIACVVEQQHDDEKGERGEKNFAARMFDSLVRLMASRPADKVTGFVVYTGSTKDVNSYTVSCYGMEATIKFRTFHVPSYSLEALRNDKRPFARVVYAGRLSLESGDDVALREKYAWELLNASGEEGYDKRQKKFILEFAGRIFRLSDPGISEGLKEAFKLRTIPLEQYVAEIEKEEAMMIGEEKGMEEKAFEVARTMLADGFTTKTIMKYTGLDESSILSLR